MYGEDIMLLVQISNHEQKFVNPVCQCKTNLVPWKMGEWVFTTMVLNDLQPIII